MSSDQHAAASSPAARDELASHIRLACLLEATPRKPGNVHPGSSFDDLTYGDFIRSAEAASPWLARSAELGVGPAVLKAIEATRRAVSTNTNLGIALLIAPLAAVPSDISLKQGVEPVLQQLTRDDAVAVYRAIRLAVPGGLGQADSQDVCGEPTITLLETMRLAAGRDRVANQYVTGFADVLDTGVSLWSHWANRLLPDWESAVIGLHLSLMATWPDTLIARKCGVPIAEESQRRAAVVLSAGWPTSARAQSLFHDFDAWLRADGHRRNPGATADLVAATLFAVLRERTWRPPTSLRLP